MRVAKSDGNHEHDDVVHAWTMTECGTEIVIALRPTVTTSSASMPRPGSSRIPLRTVSPEQHAF
jgi:hypothetical protein